MNAPKKEIILSGIRPTGRLHYGNYFGAVADFLRLQSEGHTCYYFVADYHALTTITERSAVYDNTIAMLRTYVACGLDPEKSVIYRQSDVPSTAELALLLGMIANVGLLERGTTYKDKLANLPPQKGPEGNPLSYGLMGYPVLMAADILIVQADKVPVGDDQRQHVEMAIELARKFNHRFGDALKIPSTVPRTALRLPGLDGSAKMGKSDNNTVDLLDDEKTVLSKIKSVPTTTDPQPLTGESDDPEAIIPQMPAGVAALYRLLALLAPPETFADFAQRYRRGDKFYGDLKKTVAAAISAFNAPIIERFHRPDNTEETVRAFLRENAMRVTPLALETVEGCREAMGIGRSIFRG